MKNILNSLRKKKETYIQNFKRGYHRPVSLPLWKWIVIYLLMFSCVLLYFISFITISLFPSIFKFLGIISLISAICLHKGILEMLKEWDTGSWKNTEKGKKYLKKYSSE